MKALIIYHDNCPDGMTAAWIAEGVLSQSHDTKIIPASYGDIPPWDYIDSHTFVYIVDFSYPAKDLKEVCDYAHKVVVLDHHASAIKKLSGFNHPFCTLNFSLDNTKSGAGLTWEWFFPDTPMPEFVQYVQARDLWLKDSLPDVDLVCAGMSAFEFTLEDWDKLAKTSIKALKEAGYWINKKLEKERKALLEECHPIYFGDSFAMSCNVPGFMASDMGHLILEQFPSTPFAITYYDTGKGTRKFSLRSSDSREAVNSIAEAFGGGGHRNAAGCEVALTEVNDKGWVYYPVKIPDIFFEQDEIEEEEEQQRLAKGIVDEEE